MIYTEMTKKAIKIMYEAHKNQVDKSGMPYVFHPWHVAEQMDDENSTVVALLHDVVEDTEMTLADLSNYGFNDEIIEALSLLNHDKGVDYYDYVEKVGTNYLATKVKIADLLHNSDYTRLDVITDKRKEKLIKYQNSLKYLTSLYNIDLNNCNLEKNGETNKTIK